MSNEIYPLDEWEYIRRNNGNEGWRRTVNQRLAPIFRALADDPDGYDGRYENDVVSMDCEPHDLPSTHSQCDNFRLVPKRRTITVEIEKADECVMPTWFAGLPAVVIPYKTEDKRDATLEVIRSAMEGK